MSSEKHPTLRNRHAKRRLPKAYASRRRRGISEIVATILTVAMTLIAGAAVFSFVNGQAGVTENQYGQAVAGTVNFLNERFVVANMAYGATCAPCSVSFYVYNNGQIALQLKQVLFYDSTQTKVSYACTGSSCTGTGVCTTVGTITPAIGTGTTIPIQGNPVLFTITLPSCTLASGTTYYLNILGLQGNNVIYYSVKP